MPKKKCCINGCSGGSTSFHRFPANFRMRLLWLNQIGKTKEDDLRFRNKRICGKHFDKSLKSKSRLPQYFLNSSEEETDEEEMINNGEESETHLLDHCYTYRSAEEHVAALKEQNKILNEKLEVALKNTTSTRDVDVDYIIKQKYYLNFYTSFQNADGYKMFVTILLRQSQQYSETYKNKIGIIGILNSETQIFLTLSRLRVGLLEADLAVRYGISTSTIPFWPSRDLIQRNMPQEFKRRYPSTRVILDATEIFIETPTDCVIQSVTYSTYKSHNTAKGLVGISPNGSVSYVSALYPGRTSDKQIVLCCGIINKLEPGDSVMADRGFTIEQELSAVDVDLNIPPFLGGQPQLSEAAIRIHVERSIREIKVFRILHGTVPNVLSDLLPLIWIICALLPNISREPLLNRQIN